MLKSIISIAIRTLLKDKMYSLISILGLTIGITSSMLLLLFIIDEISFDRYHKNANIYRVVSNIQETDDAFTWSITQAPLAEELSANYPEIENVVRFGEIGKGLYRNGETQFYEDGFFMADSGAVEMFSYSFLHGNENEALN